MFQKYIHYAYFFNKSFRKDLDLRQYETSTQIKQILTSKKQEKQTKQVCPHLTYCLKPEMLKLYNDQLTKCDASKIIMSLVY